MIDRALVKSCMHRFRCLGILKRIHGIFVAFFFRKG